MRSFASVTPRSATPTVERAQDAGAKSTSSEREPQPSPRLAWSFRDVGVQPLLPNVPISASSRPVIQAKLVVNRPGDRYEQEADRIAEQVMRMPDPDISPTTGSSGAATTVQRKCAKCQEEEKLQRKCAKCEEEEKLQRKEDGAQASPGTAPPIVHEVLNSPGQPLDSTTRGFFEPRLGYDFSRVRVHTGAKAGESAASVNASAYTAGGHVVFGSGQYSPRSTSGRRLLAHELAHVVQQATTIGMLQRDLAVPVARPEAVANALTPDQIQRAIRFNTSRFADPYVFAVIRDVIGISRFPAIVDAEFVQAIAGWQAQNNLPQDGRLTTATTDKVVAELRAEGKIVPALAGDAKRVELEAALTFNALQYFDQRTIRIFQALVGTKTTGVWDDSSIQRIMVWQGAHGLTEDGMVGPDTLRSLILELTASALFDDAIHVIVNAFHFPTHNLAGIAFDAAVTAHDAETTGVIGTGQPQTVRVGPTTFAADYPHMIRIIGHELQHVQQRTGATPIVNQHVREFLAFAWEVLSTDSPALTAAERVNHAHIAIDNHWNLAPAADRAPHQAIHDRLVRLIAAGGVGNF